MMRTVGDGGGRGPAYKVASITMASIAVIWLPLLLMGCQPQAVGVGSGEESVEGVGGAGTPLEVVNLRMRAYNEHDLATFLSTYSEDVEIFTYPDRSLGKGKKRLENLFEELFQEGLVHVTVHHQITKDSYVINHETVVSGGQETEYVSIYEVRKGLIRSVRFVRD